MCHVIAQWLQKKTLTEKQRQVNSDRNGHVHFFHADYLTIIHHSLVAFPSMRAMFTSTSRPPSGNIATAQISASPADSLTLYSRNSQPMEIAGKRENGIE